MFCWPLRVKRTTDLEPLADTDWPPRLASVIADMGGRPLNVHKLMANNPALLEAWWPLRNHGVRGGTLSARQRELIILRVAVHMRCWYEWASHVERGQAAGLGLEEIERVRSDPAGAAWRPEERLLLELVDECIEARGIGPASLAVADGAFTAEQLLDLMAIVGMYVTLAMMINTWGLALDPFLVLPAGLAEETWQPG